MKKIGQIEIVEVHSTNIAGTAVVRCTAPDGISHELCSDEDGTYQWLDADGYRTGQRFATLRAACLSVFDQWAL